MIRSQIYITENERNELLMMSHQVGKSQSELIREAIELLIEKNHKQKQDKLAALQAARGIWQNRTDLPDFAALRKEWGERDGAGE